VTEPTGSVSIRIPSDPKHLYLMRRLVQEVSLAHGFPEEEIRRIVLALDEACSNVIRHAYGGDAGGEILIEAGPCEDGLRFVVIDRGVKPREDAIAPRPLDDLRPGGLGTHFIRAVMDEVTYDTSSSEETRLVMIKRRKALSEEKKES
jgi:anti-sigma regulatory factor (Ser/Thr protein kinase)